MVKLQGALPSAPNIAGEKMSSRGSTPPPAWLFLLIGAMVAWALVAQTVQPSRFVDTGGKYPLTRFSHGVIDAPNVTLGELFGYDRPKKRRRHYDDEDDYSPPKKRRKRAMPGGGIGGEH